jgi:hypothetical protein
MSARTHKEEGSKNTMSRTPKSGNQKSGKPQKPCSLQKIQFVTGAELNLEFPITLTSKFTGNQNTLTYQAHWPTVMIATAVHTAESFDALFASKFAQKQKVKDAILALTIAINEELNAIEIPKTSQRKPQTIDDITDYTRRLK